MRKLTAVTALIVSSLSAAACSVSVGGNDDIEASKVEEQASEYLQANSAPGAELDDVSCDDDLKAEVDESITCTWSATLEDGSETGGDIVVTVSEIDDDTAFFEYEVTES